MTKTQQESDVAEALGQALGEVASAIMFLGNGSAELPGGGKAGAIEMHGQAILEAADRIAAGLHEVAMAIKGNQPR